MLSFLTSCIWSSPFSASSEMLLEHHPLEWQELLAGLQWAAHWRAEKEKSQPLSMYLFDMAMINRHVRSSTLVQPAFTQSTAVWENTNHVLQTTCSSTEGKHNPLVTAIAKGLGKKTPFSCACFSDPESSTIVTAHTFSIDFTGLKWFRYSHGSSDHTAEDGLWPQHYFCFLLHHWDMV